MTPLITGIVQTGGDPGSLACTANQCTASRAGSFAVALSFGTSGRTQASVFSANKIAQSISLAGGRFTVGDRLPLAATASSGLTVNYAVLDGDCVIEHGELTATQKGTCTIEATQAGDTTYLPATPVTALFTAAQASPDEGPTPPKPDDQTPQKPDEPTPPAAPKQPETSPTLAKTGVADQLPALLGLAATLLAAGALLLVRRRMS